MGHIHLGVLPRTKKWREVADLIAAGTPDDQIVAASAVAAERDLANAVYDPVFVEAVRLLALIPQAARSDDFGEGMRQLGLDVPDTPQLADLMVAASRRLDHVMDTSNRKSDFGELVRRSLLGTLSTEIGDRLPGLFAADAADVRSAAARMGQASEFSAAARSFFGRLSGDTLASWLDRALSAHVGPGKRFTDVAERAAFDAALTQYCSEATRIIREFAGGWYGKTLYRDGTVSTERAAAFGAVAFKKIGEELRRKRNAHA